MSTWRDIWRFGVIANRLYAEDENKGLKAFRKLHEVFDAGKETPDGMIHYIYGHALETKGLKEPAIIEYKRAEELFPVPHWKEVARETYDRVSQNKTPDEYFDKLESWGFRTTRNWAHRVHSLTEIQNTYNEIMLQRADIPFDIDGLVLKVNDICFNFIIMLIFILLFSFI